MAGEIKLPLAMIMEVAEPEGKNNCQHKHTVKGRGGGGICKNQANPPQSFSLSMQPQSLP